MQIFYQKKLFSTDSNKFGQKMLEKMGWSQGKGLGPKENGMIEHVKVSYKNDSKGKIIYTFNFYFCINKKFKFRNGFQG